MKISSKRLISGAVAFSFIAIFAGLTCCTKVDDTLGLDLIPGDQIMSVRVDTFGIAANEHVRTYTQLEDSVSTSLKGYSVIGRYVSEKFGKTRAASLLQMMPVTETSIQAGGYGFGEKNRADSLYLSLKPTFLAGDYEKEQTFVAYALNDTPAVDETYYKFFDYEGIKDKEPLFTFMLSGKFDTTYLVKADMTDYGMEYLQGYLSDSTYYYGNRKNFREISKGIVIEPAEDSPEDAAVYSMNLETAYAYIYFTNLGESDSKQYFVPLYFNDDEDDDVRNLSITTLSTDYAGTPIEEALALTEEMIPQEVTYVHGFGGVTTRLEFPDGFYEAIRSKQDDGTLMYLNQALIFIDLEDDSWEMMDQSHERLGSYYYYTISMGIPDYSYSDQSGSGGTSYYAGYLNRTHGYYMMDVTAFLHYALKEYDKKVAGESYLPDYMMYTLAPTYDTTMKNGETLLKGYGNEERHIWMQLTYTLVKN